MKNTQNNESINQNTQNTQNQQIIKGVKYVKGGELFKELQQIIKKYGSEEARAQINYGGVPEWMVRSEIMMMLELGECEEVKKIMYSLAR